MKIPQEENPGPQLPGQIPLQSSSTYSLLYIKLIVCKEPKFSRQSHWRSGRTEYSPLCLVHLGGAIDLEMQDTNSL